jgi:prepilin-type N-terminal cleavage/methylation domain-containing protein
VKRARGEEGFTLPELLVASVILAIIVAPLTLAFITSLRVVGKSDQKFTDSRSALISAADFSSDVANANAITTTTSPAACGSGGTLLATFLWNDPNDPDVVKGTAGFPNKVSYFYDATGKRLLRSVCKNNGAASTSTAAVSLNAAPTVQCFNSGAPSTPVACNGAAVRWVKMAVTAAPNLPTPDNPSPTPFSFTLSGTRRPTS